MSFAPSIAGETAERTLADAALIQQIIAESSARTAADTNEVLARIAAVLNEAAARAAADDAERRTRAAIQTDHNKRLAAVEHIAAATGGVGTTRLTYRASAATIADVGSDGTWLTVETSAAHGWSDGDSINVTGTSAYNGTYGPIDVLAADQFRVATTIPATAHETTGTVRTSALRVDNSAGQFLPGMWIEVLNDQATPHVSRLSATTTELLHLATPIPTSWTGAAIASPTNQVTITSKEIVLARTAIPGSEDQGYMLADVVRVLAGSWARPALYQPDLTGVQSAQTALENAVTTVTANAGVVHLDAGIYLLTQDLTTPAGSVLDFDPGAMLLIDDGVRLAIDGGVRAGRHQIFDGPGTVTGTPQIDWAFPEWFGAGTTDDDTAAWQRTWNFFPRILGNKTTKYKLYTDRYLVTLKNLHRIKHPSGDASRGWANGIYSGPIAPDNAVVKDCYISILRDTNPQTALRGTFVFSAGNPLHLDPAALPEDQARRGTRMEIDNCLFTTEDAAITNVGERYKPFIGISIDEVVLTNNKLLGHDDHYEIMFGFCFDCRTVRFTENFGVKVFTYLTLEYCQTTYFMLNDLWDSRQMLDADAHDENLICIGNVFDRPAKDKGLDDAAWEFNAPRFLIFKNNTTRKARRGSIISCKGHMYKTWGDVMSQPASTSSNTGTGLWDVVLEEGNLWEDVYGHGVLVGTDWNITPHPGELVGSRLTIKDTFRNCGWGLGLSDDHAVVRIYEGRNITLDNEITNPAARLTTLTADAAQGDLVVHVASVSGMEAGGSFSVLLNTGANRKKHITEIASFDANALTVTMATGLSYAAASGNTARYGPGNCRGVLARSFLDTDVATTVITTLAQPALAGDDHVVVTAATGLAAGAGIKIKVNAAAGVDIDYFETNSTSIVGTTVYLGDLLAYDADAGNEVRQESEAGAATASTLSISSFGGRIEDVACEAVWLNRVEFDEFDHLQVRNCGAHAPNNERRQVYINRLEARNATILGSLDIIADAAIKANYGLFLSAMSWTADAWRVILRDSRIKGHTLSDLWIADSLASAESMNNIWLDNCEVPTTNINLSTNVAFARRLRYSGTTPPTSVSGRNADHPLGTLMSNSAPALGSPIEWINLLGGGASWGEGARPKLKGSAAFAPGTVVNNANAGVTINVPGVLKASKLPVEWNFDQMQNANVITDAFVYADNQVRFVIRNVSGGDLTFTAGTVTVWVG